jgi:hypothetical protein
MWIWLTVAAIGGAGLYAFLQRNSGGAIPMPGESRRAPEALRRETEAPAGEPETTSRERPKEEIRKHERDALDRVLQERSRAR